MRRTFGAWRGGRAGANLRRAELSLADLDSRRWWRELEAWRRADRL